MSVYKARSKVSLGPAPPVIQGIQLVPATALPDKLRSVFKFDVFNAIQSKCFAIAFETDDNMIVSAPTGSGKTVVMELAICRLMAEFRGKDFKIVYQAPTKSLCSERYRDWHVKFGVLNLQCAELTGDTDSSHLQNVQSAHIILTTPEKWDSVTRKWKDHAKLMQRVKLFLVDEVHILRESRGAILEAVVSRMKSVSSGIRFVALSATVPNSEDIATWLGRNPTSQSLPAHREVFGESFRPVLLKKHVYGFETKGNDFVFEKLLTQQIPHVIANHGKGKPVMIFCPTRRACTTTAKMLADKWMSSHPSQRLWRGPDRPDRPLSFSNTEVDATSAAGVAFHHGGLSAEDRRGIEQAFLHGQINVLCCTSTLAVGVNLPCYLVILKGTTAWTDNGFQEYADLEVMQMLGRAGRPQFETSACAVILTRKEKIAHYERMVSGEEVLESCLHQNLIEHLNAEIGLGTIRDLNAAKQWLAGTFLHVRLQKNPSHYRFKEDIDENSEDDLLARLCKKDISLLHEAGFINTEPQLTSTAYGEAMARYYVSFDTMKLFVGLPPRGKTSEILSVLAQAREFREVRMQAGEKSFYKQINKAPEIKFPIKVDIALPAHKVSLVIQAELGNVAIPDDENYKKHHQQHRNDKLTVFAHANRLIRCLIDCQVHLKDAVSTRHALELGRSLAAHVWDNTASQLRQIEGLGEVAVRKLASASINSIDTLLNTEPSRIELVLGKNPPFGLELLKKLESFPNLRVSVKEISREPRPGRGVTVSFVAEIGFLNVGQPRSFKKKQQLFVCFLAETSDGDLVDFRRIGAKNVGMGNEVFLTVQLTKPTSHLNCYVMCDEIAGTSKYAELRLSGIPDSIYPSLRHLEETSTDSTTTSHGSGHGADSWDDEFDDGGIDDQDLLSVEAHGDKIEVIEDIDAILNEESQHQRQSFKTSTAMAHQTRLERDEDTDISVYREPIRLCNGRWTCQHDCKERNRKCKHKCCAEGVTKPRRRPKAESKSNGEEKVQMTMTSVATGKLKAKPVAQKAKSTERLQKSRPRSDSDTVSVGGKEHSAEPAYKRTKMSADANLGDSGLTQTSHSRRFYGPDKSNPEAKVSMRKERETKVESNSCADEDDALFDFSNSSADEVDTEHLTSQATMSKEENARPVSAMAEDDWLEQEQFPDFATSDFDLGGFEPPLDHVAMSDVHRPCKGLFVDGFSSSPAKTWIPNVEQVEREEDAFNTTADGDMCSTDPIDTIDVDHPFDLADKAGSLPTTPTEIPVDTPEETELRMITKAREQSAASVPHESEAERQQQLYEEDQKKKWEGIDQWIYDAFHEYVELV
ncbi:hypothetical protein A1O3_06277 [Capronia epimyces CBS 606.96]|uniref:DNA 3'-5' helicase n=1 Tax=Capronia epimyces CBS 606.96 TaxID=1182542 RepID=W9YJM2_9EURO|nr:uncharacterized protein A1O3_06277 [Capronia epimyces CBS 606.96]EXJ82464.1 hypothetical protein A1O3_06277 [Capronia epimyces CBS 606.96]